MRYLILSCVCLLELFVFTPAFAQSVGEQPNILFGHLEGYNDLECNGAEEPGINSSNADGLVSEATGTANSFIAVNDGELSQNVFISNYPALTSPGNSNSRKEKTLGVSYSSVIGIGKESGVMRRDPSDIIMVDDLYYVWYSKGNQKTGYDATVWYATSPDGIQWKEKGEAIGKGAGGSWDAGSVFTPNIMVAEGRYWLFFTGVSKLYGKGFNPDSKIGVAVADSPDGPWMKLPNNPVLKNSDNPEHFDSHLVDDACLIVKDGKYRLYYKGRKLGESPHQTKMGVALAEKPEGPYVKYKNSPIINGNHAVLVWPHGKGVAAMIDGTGPPDLIHSVLYSDDGIRFNQKLCKIEGPAAAGAFRYEHFSETQNAKPVCWGLEIGSENGSLPFLRRYDLNWEKIDDEN